MFIMVNPILGSSLHHERSEQQQSPAALGTLFHDGSGWNTEVTARMKAGEIWLRSRSHFLSPEMSWIRSSVTGNFNGYMGNHGNMFSWLVVCCGARTRAQAAQQTSFCALVRFCHLRRVQRNPQLNIGAIRDLHPVQIEIVQLQFFPRSTMPHSPRFFDPFLLQKIAPNCPN